MAEDKIRVGIIGANAHYGWSMRPPAALRAMPDYELTAVYVAPRDGGRVGRTHGARLAFHDYRWSGILTSTWSPSPCVCRCTTIW